MSDVCINTKRFTNSVDFAGASENDLLRIAAQVLIYAGEVAPCHVGADDSATTANILRNLREEDDTLDFEFGGDCHFRFNYLGETWVVMDQDFYEQYREDCITMLMENIQEDIERATKDLGALSSYITIDEEALVRDMDYGGEVEMMMATYDGVLHHLQFNEYKSGDGSLVTKRCDIYAYRED
jgi:hypothetical protein